MPTIARTGKPTQFTLEFEVLDILRRLAQGKRHQGALLSTLLRQEEQRRIEARKWRETQPVLVEGGSE